MSIIPSLILGIAAIRRCGGSGGVGEVWVASLFDSSGRERGRRHESDTATATAKALSASLQLQPMDVVCCIFSQMILITNLFILPLSDDLPNNTHVGGSDLGHSCPFVTRLDTSNLRIFQYSLFSPSVTPVTEKSLAIRRSL